MTLFRLAENLSIRVGRDGIWIWAPDASPRPIHLDARALSEMGLRLGKIDAPETAGSNPPSRDPERNA